MLLADFKARISRNCLSLFFRNKNVTRIFIQTKYLLRILFPTNRKLNLDSYIYERNSIIALQHKILARIGQCLMVPINLQLPSLIYTFSNRAAQRRDRVRAPGFLQ